MLAGWFDTKLLRFLASAIQRDTFGLLLLGEGGYWAPWNSPLAQGRIIGVFDRSNEGWITHMYILDGFDPRRTNFVKLKFTIFRSQLLALRFDSFTYLKALSSEMYRYIFANWSKFN